jgi:hypothetical protein
VNPPDDEARFAPGEQARVDEAMVRVARHGRGPAVVAVLVGGAFLLGLIRPWDWLSSGTGSVATPPAPTTEAGAAAPSPYAGVAGAPSSARTGGGPEPLSGAPTCAYPTTWRTATIQLWAGARARVWTAAEAVPATGVLDPSIPFNLVGSEAVEAIGWCAPVSGPERPPLAARATLYRLVDGIATEVAVDRLEPVARDALGELWLPREGADGRRAAWAPGRYVIRLAAPAGGYERYLGLQVGPPEPKPEPSAAPSPGSSAVPSPESPSAAPSPGPTAAASAPPR